MAPISQTTSQVANKRVTQALAPQLAQQTSYGAHQNAVIRAFANSLLGRLQPIAGQVGADYDAAIKQIGGLSGQAAGYLNAQNPVTQQQALQSSVGAPASQQAQAAQGLSDTFQGGAGVLAFRGGTIPGSELAANKAAAMAQARTLPAIAGLAGQQSLASAAYMQSQARQKLLATRPGLVQQEETAIQRTNLQRQTLKQRADAAKTTAAYHQAQLDAKAHTINAFASKQLGHLVYNDNTDVKDVHGNQIPYRDTSASAKSTFKPDQYGRIIEYAPDGTMTVRSSGMWTDKNTGTTYTVGLDGKRTVFSTKPATTAAPSDAAQTAPARFDSANSNALGIRTDQYGDAILYGKDKQPVLMPGWKWGKNGMPVKQASASSSTTAPSTQVRNGVTYQWSKKPDGSTGWVKADLPVATTTTKAPGPYPNLTKAQVVHLRGGIANDFYGVPEQKDADGNVTQKALLPMSYQAAIKDAVRHGHSRADATKMANRFYKPGQRGRPPAKGEKPTYEKGIASGKLAGPPAPGYR